jgi:hypothetical protein
MVIKYLLKPQGLFRKESKPNLDLDIEKAKYQSRLSSNRQSLATHYFVT